MGSDYLTKPDRFDHCRTFLFKQNGTGSGNLPYCMEGGVAAIVANDYCRDCLKGHSKF